MACGISKHQLGHTSFFFFFLLEIKNNETLGTTMNVYQQIDDLEADAVFWETRAKNLRDLLSEAKSLLLSVQEQGILTITELELAGLISTIDEEVSQVG